MNNLYYNIKNFIKNLIKYRRLLWIDRWWDDYYIFFMLREKLIEDVKKYKKYGIHLYVQKDIDKMEFCIKLLNRICDDGYLKNALFFYNKKYPEWGSLTEELDEPKMFHRCCERERYLKQQDIDFLFKYMSKHILGWWD